MPAMTSFLAPLGALGVLAVALALTPGPAPLSTDELAERAIAEMRLGGEPTAVAAAYQEVLRRDPSHVRANFGVGFAAYQAKDYEAADKHLRTALEKDPANAEIKLALAASAQKQKRYDEAIAAYAELLAANPKDGRFLNNLGELEIARRNYPAARDYLTRYLDTLPRRSAARKKLQKRIDRLTRMIGDAPAKPAPSPAPSTRK